MSLIEPKLYNLVIEDSDGKVHFNNEFLDVLNRSTNPRILMLYGKTRIGKSKTLDMIIAGYDNMDFGIQQPFYSITQPDSQTIGCDIYGPLRLKQLCEDCEVEFISSKEEDCDIFLCDSEGLDSLNGKTKLLLPGLLTMLPVVTTTVMMIDKVIANQNVNDVLNLRALFNFMKDIIHNELPSTVFFITGYDIGFNNGEKKSKLNQKRLDAAEDFKKLLNKRLKDDGIDKDLFGPYYPIVSGPFSSDLTKDDIKGKIYWKSIQDIIRAFKESILKHKSQTGHEIAQTIEALFSYFSRFDSIPKYDCDMRTFISNVFSQVFREELQNIENEIMAEIGSSLESGVKYSDSTEENEETIVGKFNPVSYNMCSALILGEMKTAIKESSSRICSTAKEQVDLFVSNSIDSIKSERTIQRITRPIVDVIRSSKFREDIDQSIFNEDAITQICENELQSNRELYEYLKSHQKNHFDNILENMIIRCENQCQDAVNSVVQWEKFFSEKKNEINALIDELYQRRLKAANYTEDFNAIENPENFTRTSGNNIVTRVFANEQLAGNRMNEVTSYILSQATKVYNSYDANRLPSFSSIKSEYQRIIDRAANELQTGIQGKLRDEIDRNFLNARNVESYLLEKIQIDQREKNSGKEEEIKQMVATTAENVAKRLNALYNSAKSWNDVRGSVESACTNVLALYTNNSNAQMNPGIVRDIYSHLNISEESLANSKYNQEISNIIWERVMKVFTSRPNPQNVSAKDWMGFALQLLPLVFQGVATACNVVRQFIPPKTGSTTTAYVQEIEETPAANSGKVYQITDESTKKKTTDKKEDSE